MIAPNTLVTEHLSSRQGQRVMCKASNRIWNVGGSVIVQFIIADIRLYESFIINIFQVTLLISFFFVGDRLIRKALARITLLSALTGTIQKNEQKLINIGRIK